MTGVGALCQLPLCHHFAMTADLVNTLHSSACVCGS